MNNGFIIIYLLDKPVETFPFNQAKPRWSMYQLKRWVLPWLYWNRILKGTA